MRLTAVIPALFLVASYLAQDSSHAACASGPQTRSRPFDSNGSWSLLSDPQSGPVRTQHTAIYDPLRDRLVVFGGNIGYPGDNDVWILTLGSEQAWSKLEPLGARPQARFDHTAIDDPLRHRMILYGGLVNQPQHNDHTVNDVWMLDLTSVPTWSALGEGPNLAGSAGHSAFYDPVRDRMIVVGGSFQQGGGMPHSYDARVWSMSLDGPPVWTELTSGGTAPQSAYRAAYDALRDRILVAGVSALGLTQGVWARPADDVGDWAPLASSGTMPVLGNPMIYDPVRDRFLIGYTGTGAPGEDLDQVWALNFDESVPVSTPLVSTDATSDVVRLVWQFGEEARTHATVYRREAGLERTAVASLTPNALDQFEFEDHQVRAGEGYGYRLGIRDSEEERFVGEVWVNVPGWAGLVIEGARPNPTTGPSSVTIILPEARHATLDLFNIAGRRIWTREVGALGLGRHAVALDAGAWTVPGVYHLRLSQGAQSVALRFVVLR